MITYKNILRHLLNIETQNDIMGSKYAKSLFLALFPVLAVLAISGCVNPFPTGGTGAGITVEVFEPSLSSVRSNEQLDLHLEVRNIGDYNNAPAVAELTELDPVEWSLYGDRYKFLGNLLAPDAESQTEGGRAIADWSVTAPALKRGQSLTYNPRARIYYYYETKSIKPVTFVTSEELRKTVQAGGSLSSEATETTSGPLSVEVTTGSFVRAQDFRESKFQLQIHIDNTGSGTVYGTDNPLAVQVKYPQFVVPVGDCPRFEQTGWVPYPSLPQGLLSPVFGKYVKLWNGKSTDLTCEFTIVEPPTNRLTANFEVTLGYIYYVDTTTQISVQGTEEF